MHVTLFVRFVVNPSPEGTEARWPPPRGRRGGLTTKNTKGTKRGGRGGEDDDGNIRTVAIRVGWQTHFLALAMH